MYGVRFGVFFIGRTFESTGTAIDGKHAPSAVFINVVHVDKVWKIVAGRILPYAGMR